VTLVESAIGTAMRLYRRSPLYPRAGRTLARALARMPGRPDTAVRTIRGVTYQLDLTDAIGASLYYSGTFEAKTERLIESSVRPGMTTIDIGANFGYHTFRLAQCVGTQGRVLAVEPMAEAWQRLLANAQLNDFPQIAYRQVGLSDAELGVTSVAFRSHYDIDGSRSIAEEDVRITTVDSLVAEEGLDQVDFVKLDVDGYEGKVLRGARATLEQWHPDVLFEISPGMMDEQDDRAEDLIAFLEGLGYRLVDEDRGDIDDVRALMGTIGNHSINLLATTK
jgi:FkbM family methyltransferase